jgi:hypothetical protein
MITSESTNPAAEGASPPYPAFRCHKIVQALKIVAIETVRPQVVDGGSSAYPARLKFDGPWAPIEVDASWVGTRRPQEGGYYVVYEDGYTSWSPAKQFEAGYTPVADWGLSEQQEPKYGIDGRTARIINRATGQPIPDDEPVIIFRAKDDMALEALTAYRNALEARCDDLAPDHSEAGIQMGEALAAALTSVDERLAAFRAFREQHQDRLRYPT